jgi:hypothetical protein
MGIFGSRKKQKVIAVLEVASDSVGGMLIQQNKESNPKIISRARIPVNFLLDINFDAFWRCTRASLQQVLQKLLKDYPQGPDVCLCVFLSPWFISQTKIVNVQRKESFKTTRSFFEKLLKAEEENFMRDKSKFFIEHEIVKVELNGYYTKSPLEKFAKTVRAYIYLSLGIKEVKTEIEKEVLKNFGDIPLSFKTFPLLAFKILSNIINTQEGLILVDIGGEITDISLLRKDSLEETVSFPLGRNFLLRKIASEFKTFPKEAPSLLQTCLKGHAAKCNAEKISQILQGAGRKWCDSFTKALESISENTPLPQNLFLMGEESISSQFIEFIKCTEDKKFSKFTLLGKPFHIQKILSEGLAHYFTSGEKKDVFLMLESLFANKVL